MRNPKVFLPCYGRYGCIQIAYSSKSLHIYSIIVRNTGIIHIINNSRPQITRPWYYQSYFPYTLEWIINKKNPSCRCYFILKILYKKIKIFYVIGSSKKKQKWQMNPSNGNGYGNDKGKFFVAKLVNYGFCGIQMGPIFDI